MQNPETATIEHPAFVGPMLEISQWLARRDLTPSLSEELAQAFPPDGEAFTAIADACERAIEQDRLGRRVDASTVYARVFQPAAESCEFSIDVVKLTNVHGARHTHPRGEVDMIIPLDAGARFNGHGRGWLVMGPGSAHSPTVQGGSAIVVYFLPGGEMTF